MSNINVRHKFIFIHVPKTAGVAMESVDWNATNVHAYKGHYTIQDFVDYGIDIKKYFKWCFIRNPWDRLLSGYDYSSILKKQFPVFTDLVDAIYRRKTVYNKLNCKWSSPSSDGIPNLLTNTPHIFFYSQLSLITYNNVNQMDFIGRFENINEDWARLCIKMKELGVASSWPEEKWKLPVANARDKDNIKNVQYKERPYQEYYTEDTKNMVAEIYENDINTFNYKFD